jgi:hypothetical protein
MNEKTKKNLIKEWNNIFKLYNIDSKIKRKITKYWIQKIEETETEKLNSFLKNITVITSNYSINKLEIKTFGKNILKNYEEMLATKIGLKMLEEGLIDKITKNKDLYNISFKAYVYDKHRNTKLNRHIQNEDK